MTENNDSPEPDEDSKPAPEPNKEGAKVRLQKFVSGLLDDTRAARAPKEVVAPTVYKLKTMIAIRMMAECTVMGLLILLPFGLFIFGQFMSLTITVKIILIALALLAACILPLYGLITYKVTVQDDSVTTHSIWKRRTCRFALLKSLTRRSNWNMVRYVVDYEGGEISFPIWLDQHETLVALLREHLPKGAGALNPFRTFKQDPVSLCFQVGQAVLSLIFIGVVWCFTSAVQQSGHHNVADTGLLIVFALIISAVMLWRAYVIALMPSSIELKTDQLIVHTWFFEKKLQWSELKAVSEPYPLLPEGILIKTSKGSYLVGNGMDAADDLETALRARL